VDQLREISRGPVFSPSAPKPLGILEVANEFDSNDFSMEEFNLELFREFDCSDCLEFLENSEIPAAFLDDEEAATSLPEAL
jgi:hypothetical protein